MSNNNRQFSTLSELLLDPPAVPPSLSTRRIVTCGTPSCGVHTITFFYASRNFGPDPVLEWNIYHHFSFSKSRTMSTLEQPCAGPPWIILCLDHDDCRCTPCIVWITKVSLWSILYRCPSLCTLSFDLLMDHLLYSFMVMNSALTTCSTYKKSRSSTWVDKFNETDISDHRILVFSHFLRPYACRSIGLLGPSCHRASSRTQDTPSARIHVSKPNPRAYHADSWRASERVLRRQGQRPGLDGSQWRIEKTTRDV